MRKKLEQVRHIVSDCQAVSGSLAVDKLQEENVIESVNQFISIDNQSIPSMECDDTHDEADDVTYLIDDNGVAKLPDGTVVVQPMPPDDEQPQEDEAITLTQGQQSNDAAIITNTTTRPSVYNNNTNGSSSLNNSTNNLHNQKSNQFENVKCTRCADVIDVYNDHLYSHPQLSVLFCTSCYLHYTEHSQFQRDPKDNKDNQCRWCCGFGDLLCCDICSNSFCARCIKRNLGREHLAQIRDISDDVIWKCFICNPQPIQQLQDNCHKIIHVVNHFKEKQRLQTERSNRLRVSSTLLSEGTSPTLLPQGGQSTNTTASSSLKRQLPPISSSSSTEQCGFAYRRPSSTSSASTTFQQQRSIKCKKTQLLSSSETAAASTSRPSLAAASTSSSSTYNNADPLAWLYDNDTVNINQLQTYVFGALRNVATFYRDLHRLQQATTTTTTMHKQVLLREFRNTFYENFVQRLGRLPNFINENDSKGPTTNFDRRTSRTQRQQQHQHHQQKSHSHPPTMSTSSASPVTIDLTDDNDDVPESQPTTTPTQLLPPSSIPSSSRSMNQRRSRKSASSSTTTSSIYH